jgi:hypothetical protein
VGGFPRPSRGGIAAIDEVTISFRVHGTVFRCFMAFTAFLGEGLEGYDACSIFIALHDDTPRRNAQGFSRYDESLLVYIARPVGFKKQSLIPCLHQLHRATCVTSI